MTYRNCFFYTLALAGFVGCAASCANLMSCELPDTGRVTVMSYNTQTFFDADECGNEFDEFKGGKSAWSEERYLARLDQLKEAIVLGGEASGMCPGVGPDVVVLQEIENAGVLRDIGGRFTSAGAYPYAAFVPQESGGAFSIGLLSRFPVVAVRAHQTVSGGVFLRPLVEAVLDVRGTELTVFAVHWKSKSGDESSAELRLEQEVLLDRRIRALEAVCPGALWIACGDFNQTMDEFTVLSGYANGWNFFAVPESKPVLSSAVVSGKSTSGIPVSGLSASGVCGSYYYNGAWEGIDHFFASCSLVDGSDAEIGGFRTVYGGRLLASSGEPARYEIFSGKGYSDHLPVVIAIEAWN